jgi:hypothetical protein
MKCGNLNFLEPSGPLQASNGTALPLHRVKDVRNILNAIKRRKAKWIGHVLHRNCLLKHVIEGKTEGKNKGWEDEEEDVPRYWIALKNREDTGN